jgi:hypothetical protein
MKAVVILEMENAGWRLARCNSLAHDGETLGMVLLAF